VGLCGWSRAGLGRGGTRRSLERLRRHHHHRQAPAREISAGSTPLAPSSAPAVREGAVSTFFLSPFWTIVTSACVSGCAWLFYKKAAQSREKVFSGIYSFATRLWRSANPLARLAIVAGTGGLGVLLLFLLSTYELTPARQNSTPPLAAHPPPLMSNLAVAPAGRQSLSESPPDPEKPLWSERIPVGTAMVTLPAPTQTNGVALINVERGCIYIYSGFGPLPLGRLCAGIIDGALATGGVNYNILRNNRQYEAQVAQGSQHLSPIWIDFIECARMPHNPTVEEPCR
jgi:hypothetical protein